MVKQFLLQVKWYVSSKISFRICCITVLKQYLLWVYIIWIRLNSIQYSCIVFQCVARQLKESSVMFSLKTNFLSFQVGILVLARTQLLPWRWEVHVSSLLAEIWRRQRKLWGRLSLRVTAWMFFTWSWIWPTWSLSESSARTSSRERRDSTSWSTMQVLTQETQ